MSVKDRISKMNSLIVVETEKAQEPEKPIMRSLSLDVSLRFKGSETKSKGSVSYLKSRSSDGSMRSPLKLPGMEMEKGASRFEEENPQDTDIEEVLQKLKDNDVSLTEVNLNNHGGLDAEVMRELFEALRDNACLEVLQLSNVRLDEGQATELAGVLKFNVTLRVLNLDSNRITRKGIKAIMRALSENPDTVLKELRMVNQYFAGGAGAEGEIAKYMDKIKTITKLGYNFTVPSYRSKVDCLIMRNLDYDRKRRVNI